MDYDNKATSLIHDYFHGHIPETITWEEAVKVVSYILKNSKKKHTKKVSNKH